MHHKGRNKHHLEYWIDYDLVKRDGSMTGMKMPDNYIVEMFCDRVAASKIYHEEKGDYTDSTALGYFLNGKSKGIMHPYSRKRLEMLLRMLAEKGENETFAYAKRYMEGYRRYLKRKKYKKKMEKKLEKKYSQKMSSRLDKAYKKRMKRDVRKTKAR